MQPERDKKPMSLAKLSQQIISTDDEFAKIYEELKRFTIPLIPETTRFSDQCLQMGITLVKASTVFPPKWSKKSGSWKQVEDEEKKGNSDIYQTDNREYALHAPKLNEIAKAAGIQIDKEYMSQQERDPQSQLLIKVVWTVEGHWRGIDGQTHNDVANGSWDYYADLADGKTDNELKRRRSKADAHAATNAKSRFYRKALTLLKGTYSLEELEKPFAVPFVVDDKRALIASLPEEYRDQAQIAMTYKRLGITDAIYPQQKQYALPETPKMPELTPPNTNDSISDAQIITPKTENKIDEAQVIETKPPVDDGEAIVTAEGYRDKPQDIRTAFFLKLRGERELTEKSSGVTIDAFEKKSIDTQIKFLANLLGLPVKKKQQEDLPF